ncbi:hypothetical protein Emed_006240 [Eimeria media]
MRLRIKNKELVFAALAATAHASEKRGLLSLLPFSSPNEGVPGIGSVVFASSYLPAFKGQRTPHTHATHCSSSSSSNSSSGSSSNSNGGSSRSSSSRSSSSRSSSSRSSSSGSSSGRAILPLVATAVRLVFVCFSSQRKPADAHLLPSPALESAEPRSSQSRCPHACSSSNSRSSSSSGSSSNSSRDESYDNRYSSNKLSSRLVGKKQQQFPKEQQKQHKQKQQPQQRWQKSEQQQQQQEQQQQQKLPG